MNFSVQVSVSCVFFLSNIEFHVKIWGIVIYIKRSAESYVYFAVGFLFLLKDTIHFASVQKWKTSYISHCQK